MNCNVANRFANAASRYPDNMALAAGKTQLTYGKLRQLVQQVSAQVRPALRQGRVGVLGSRSIEACAAFLGIAWAGGTYVPLGLNHPDQRLIALLELLELDALIVDRAGFQRLSPELRRAAPPLILAPQDEPGTFAPLDAELPAADLELSKQPAEVGPDHLAYIIFTSGTTGMPKGVMVNSRSIGLYLDAIHPWYELRPQDRAAETCEANFDLSIHNMLTAWSAGAGLYIMRPLDMVAPARFIRANQITTWLSVPSIVALMRQAGGLTASSLTSLRLTWFCGEPLSVQAVRDWSEAAPNSIIENFYGPTEITVAVLRQRWDGEGPVTRERGIVAIGEPIQGVEAIIVDAAGQPVPDGIPGEIVLAAEQCSQGYFKLPDLTAEKFREFNGKPGYLTGDRGYRDHTGVFHHLGRLDNQIKYKGHRIELEEIDARLREAAEAELVGTVTWPMTGDVVGGLAAFYSSGTLEPEQVRARLRQLLPPYMVPELLENIADMPLSSNGKVDRKALVALLNGRDQARAAS
ncbi:MAG: AMP-binding protein [Hoeflea sp.]|uniref:AMP-binding protein n=1 Tax=Hoeflea sp. TaxID=1940281 RepID=UPI001D6199D9|nr:AMP-binding protein [Hoeflea sp.]MBU4530359.1 AMP-binding protein [Alphaproteobacteria bacterium]MBU4545146.1 AMP-binding protein [Alphaproteobacteria bacterium]MBU4549654.1 AMP-binding protein [Alphaproteobacteria bacterium]MBV1721949.1 AMP-binding protein [Hoeflea sp.]MBV1761299.1 AMP-binding protein [Hoeflea sp.]